MHSYKIWKTNLEESFHGEAYEEGKWLKNSFTDSNFLNWWHQCFCWGGQVLLISNPKKWIKIWKNLGFLV
jgi:hypothetical protein